jgi:gliding motility-associated-like protein
LDIQSYQLVIYNRWGEKVYIGVDPKMGWDGTFKGESLQSGVYAYVLQAEFVDEDGELFEVLRSGDLTILR